jgi:hypothetical protein
MILKKFFGETVEDAKKQAMSRYGRNFVVMETFAAEGAQQAGITIAVDPPEVAPAPTAAAAGDGGFRNVFYKRSGSLRTADATPVVGPAAAAQASASRLQRLRALVETSVEPVPLRPGVTAQPLHTTSSGEYAGQEDDETEAQAYPIGPRHDAVEARPSLRPSPGRRFNLRGADGGSDRNGVPSAYQHL